MTAATDHIVLVHPRDPIILRDARPFAAEPGARAVTLDWPLPQTLAGAFRTRIGTSLGFKWQDDGPARARAIGFQGPFLAVRRGDTDWSAYLPAPADAVLYQDDSGEKHLLCRRPMLVMPDGGGCNLPFAGLRPLTVEQDVKPLPGAAFWSLAATTRWLAMPRSVAPPPEPEMLGRLERDSRVHVAIQRNTQARVEGALFTTTALVFAEDVVRRRGDDVPATAILCRVLDAPAGWQAGDAALVLGGERRTAWVDAGKPSLWPSYPVGGLPAGGQKLRLQLATPAIFNAGWLPGWIDRGTLRGHIPGLPELPLKLVSAAVSRRVPISGWDLQAGRRGQSKATRYAAPAGSVYFFETDATITDAHLRALWLRPVGDESQDSRDGYGLALPGVW